MSSVVKCENCGAPLDFRPGETTTVCKSCGYPSILRPSAPALITQEVPIRSRSVELALTASLAAFYVAFRVIPTFPMFGVPGATFRFGDMVAPLYGILLGPLLAPLAVAIGTIVAFSTGAPPVFLGLDFLPASVSAAIVGLISRGRRKEAFLMDLGLLVTFMALPFAPGPIRVGTASVPYVWLYVVALALLVSPLTKWASNVVLQDWRRISKQTILAVLSLALIGALAQHVTGGVLTQAVFGLYFHKLPGRFPTWQAFWTFLFPVYPFERAVIAIIATFIAVPAILILKVSGLSKRLPRIL